MLASVKCKENGKCNSPISILWFAHVCWYTWVDGVTLQTKALNSSYLFSDAVSILDNIAWNARQKSEQWIGKDLVLSWFFTFMWPCIVTNFFRAGPVWWINSWWWTDELSETCTVSWQNKFVKLVHLVSFIIKKYPGVRLKGWICKTLVRMSSLDLLHMNMGPCAMKQECFPFHHDIWYKFLMYCCVSS
jgi:hypothetical protein